MSRLIFFVRCTVVLLITGIWGATAGAVDQQEIDEAVQRGVAYLTQKARIPGSGRRSLAGLALLKADEPANGPDITEAIEDIQSKIDDGEYKPQSGRDRIYEAGVDAMLLSDSNPNENRPELEAVVRYILDQQNSDGDWDYLKRTVGDTSMSQYGLLGLWAASRAGIKIPPAAWDRAAGWHLKNQSSDGGFAYHPGIPEGPGNGASTHNMTAGGTGSLLIARMHLYPNAKDGPWAKSPRSVQKKKLKLGFLQQRKFEEPPPEQASQEKLEIKVPVNYSPKASRGGIDSAAKRSLGWLTQRFQAVSTAEHKLYYYYTMERMASLANVEKMGDHDWFDECATAVLQMQKPDGSWHTFSGPVVGTSFAILFLTRSTLKTLRRSPQIGGGIMHGRRGLQEKKLKPRKILGPIGELLDDLVNSKDKILEARDAIIEKVQIGGRNTQNELMGQTKLLKKLARHPNPEFRRTAIWLLGRSGDFSHVGVAVRALEDPYIDVVIEARNALCWLSRKPRGFGLPNTPLQGLVEDAPAVQRDAAIAKWRTKVRGKWREWYMSVRPYDQRDDLSEVEFKQR